MRYERDVVLEMQPGVAVPSEPVAAAPGKTEPVARAAVKKPIAGKLPGKKAAPAAKVATAKDVPRQTTANSEVAFDVPAKKHVAQPITKMKHFAQVSPR
jgi:hypothetical protein